MSNISRYDALLFNWAVLNRDNGVDINFESERFIIPGTPPVGAEYRQSPGSGCSSGEAGPSTQLDSPEDAPSFIPAGRGERCAVPGYTLRMGTSGYGHYRTRAFQVPATRPAPSLPPAAIVARPAPSWPPGWVNPADVGATGCVTDEDAVQDTIRMEHIQSGMSGIMPAPAMQVPGSLAAQAAT